MYYFRKFSSLSTFHRITGPDSIDLIQSDVLKQEFGTTNNKLSFWKSESLTNWEDAKRAIILSTTSISKIRFFVFEDSDLDKYNIRREFSELGKTGYAGAANLHVNLQELDYTKIGKLFEIIRDCSKEEKKFPELSIEDVKEVITETAKEGRIDYSSINIKLFKDIGKYRLDPSFPNELFEQMVEKNCKECMLYKYCRAT